MAGNNTFDIRNLNTPSQSPIRPNPVITNAQQMQQRAQQQNAANEQKKREEAAKKKDRKNNPKGGTRNNSKAATKTNPTTKAEPNKNKVQTEEGPEEFDVLPDAANLDAINAEYTKHIMYFDVHPETVHSVYGTADLKKIRMSLDEE